MNRYANALVVVTVLGIAGGCKRSPTEPAAGAPPDSTAISGWSLVWHDEFNDSTVNTTRWNFELGGGGWGNNELETYTSNPENSWQEQGWLVIAAQKHGSSSYTSARMTTWSKGDWLYGRVDVRAKLPYGKGLWPAIWMMPTDSYYGTWPASGEMDIMELLGDNTTKVYGTLHFANGSGQHQSTGGSYTLTGGTFAGSFHLFSYEWSANAQTWSVDGHPYYTSTKGSPFDKRFFLILNVAVGGNWPGNPDVSTTFPQFMIVDYVRVYSR
jgi:beta-glucanase (GH16 family)